MADITKGSKIDKRFDSLFKGMMADIDFARSSISGALPEPTLKHIFLDTLTPTDASFIDDEFKQTHSDKVFEVKTTDGLGYITIICEHQSTADEYMVIRLIEYMCKAIRHHLQRGHKHYPIVIPVLIYNGVQSPYPYSTDFFDYFHDPKLAKELMFKPFPLVDVSHMTDKSLLDNPLTAFPYLLLKHVQFENKFMPVLKRMHQKRIIAQLEKMGKGHLLDMLIQFMYKEAELNNEKETSSIISDESTRLGKLAMTLEETITKKALDKHAPDLIAQGEQVGAEKRSLEIAKSMLLESIDENLVAKTTGLAFDVVAQIKQSITH